MRWLKVRVETVPMAEEAVAELLRSAGAEGVALLEDGEGGLLVEGFVPESRQGDAAGLESRVRALAAFGLDPGPGRVTAEWVSEQDWAETWKRDYKPIAFGRRLLVKPAWLPNPPEAHDRVVIELDPGMAFGTGYHPTTALCLEALDEFVAEGDIVADVGTGSGILAIAAARLGAERVVAVDTSAESVAVAEENCRRNRVADVVRVGEGSAAAALEMLGDRRADVLVVNILARVIRRLAPELAVLLRPGGLFIFSGIIEHAAEDVIRCVRQYGLDVAQERNEGDWACLIGRRRD